LLVNELVTNAFKYAFPDGRAGKVVITFQVEDADGVLIIRDDGVGLPPDFNPGTGPSLGTRLVQIFGRQLHGDFDWEPGHPGTLFRLRFPIDIAMPHASTSLSRS
jgi:two-component sensor histidine kinase